jgi:hypothetical protein
MGDLIRARPDVAHTQPIETSKIRSRTRETRSFRLLRTIVFGLAILIGIATVVVLVNDDESIPNSASVYSPSGHMPSEPSSNPRVVMAWAAVKGAAGYWWAVVEDPAHLPHPVIRPSGNDRRVYFRFSGRGYFVLRTAIRDGNELHWSRELLYGPIVIRDRSALGAEPETSLEPGASPGSSAVPGTGGAADGSGSSGASGGPRATPDPRYAGQPGSCGTSGSCGSAGQPGQPAQEPGGGNQRPGSSEGQPGANGPDGGDGPT